MERDEPAEQIERLTQELAAARESLHATIEQLELTNEALRSANERGQSADAEMQRLIEELEISKDEIQCANEELTMVDEELHHINVALDQTNSDLAAALESAESTMATVQDHLLSLDMKGRPACGLGDVQRGSREVRRLLGRILAEKEARMNVKVESGIPREGVGLIVVDGEVDVYTAPRLKHEISDLMNRGVTRLVVDLDAAEYLDSSALGVLLGALKRVREKGGDLKIVCSNPRCLRIFEITKLTEVLGICASEGEALEAV